MRKKLHVFLIPMIFICLWAVNIYIENIKEKEMLIDIFYSNISDSVSHISQKKEWDFSYLYGLGELKAAIQVGELLKGTFIYENNPILMDLYFALITDELWAEQNMDKIIALLSSLKDSESYTELKILLSELD